MEPRHAQPDLAGKAALGHGAGTHALAARISFSLWAAALILAAAGLIFGLASRPDAPLYEFWVAAIVSPTFATLGALIVSRRPGNVIGWLFFVPGVAGGFQMFSGQYATVALFSEASTLPVGATAAWLSTLMQTLFVSSIFFLILLFPTGRLPSPRWRVVAGIGALAIAAWIISRSLRPGPLEDFPSTQNPFGLEAATAMDVLGGVGGWVGPACFVAVVASLITRFRHSRSEERMQIKWFAYAATLGFLAILLGGEGPLGTLVWTVAPLSLPVSAAIAILKYRLYDIDVIINRTLVYGALTACVVGIYVLIVGYLGAVFQTSGSLAISLVATGLVAVVFAPLRDRLQRAANRLMYGERDDPYAVISRLGRRLEGTLSPEAVMPAIAEDVARALRLPHTSIWLADNDSFRLEASHGEAPEQTPARDPDAIAKLRHAPDGLYPMDLDPSGEYGTLLAKSGAALVLPLSHRGELVGAISLSPRSPGEGFSPADRQLLRDVATQAGAAAHAIRLTAALRSSLEELRRSRERLVAAQEEERRRIQRDLHDGLGPILASMRLRLEACLDTHTNGEPSEAPLTGDLERLYELVGQATGDIRRLVHDLRPPVLDQLGLVPALRQHCERFHRETGIIVDFEAEENLPVPAAAEAAILRVAQEALLNVEKHARASRVDVHLERSDGSITLTIRDDGAGMDEPRDGAAGTGIGSMRERADLLGGELCISAVPEGGTEVSMRVPSPDREAVK
ncbi:MAG: GAF domain-containing sensor histidine kinase [Rubrobacter sp.]|nr:GAF domain-containing sensor histidine kinase [Rubrobacter sp.]